MKRRTVQGVVKVGPGVWDVDEQELMSSERRVLVLRLGPR